MANWFDVDLGQIDLRERDHSVLDAEIRQNL